MHRSFRWVALLSVALITVLGVARMTVAQDATDRSQLRFVVVSHGQASDPFWSVVQQGVEQAGKDMGVTVEYQAPTSTGLDVAAMAQLIDAAVASQPDGLIVSVPDPDALGPSITAAVEAGIPRISARSTTSGKPNTRQGSALASAWAKPASRPPSVSTRRLATWRSTNAAKASPTAWPRAVARPK
jgi:ABC-type sugar transport system substrate-binding protein